MAESQLTKSDVVDIVGAMFKQFAPILESLALTPEKLREANKPYVDPAVTARMFREQQNWRQQEEENRKTRELIQSQCTHKDKNGRWAISLQHNFHDLLPRGICTHCLVNIWPAHIEFKPVDGKSTAVLIKAHALYEVVQQLEASS